MMWFCGARNPLASDLAMFTSTNCSKTARVSLGVCFKVNVYARFIADLVGFLQSEYRMRAQIITFVSLQESWAYDISHNRYL